MSKLNSKRACLQNTKDMNYRHNYFLRNTFVRYELKKKHRAAITTTQTTFQMDLRCFSALCNKNTMT